MKLSKIYELAVEKGIKEDPRGIGVVRKELRRAKDKYEKLPSSDKAEFDKERLVNPYADTRLLSGKPEAVIKNILVGIDIETAEILLADRLRGRGTKMDLVIGHHPSGVAYANFYDVMHMQANILSNLGVPIAVAEGLMSERIREVERRVMPSNYSRAVDAAKLLGIPFMCIHTPADNSVATYLQKMMDEKKPERLEDIISLLKTIPEYRAASNEGSGPRIFLGDPGKHAGKIFVEMTGGTEGSKNIFERLTQSGVDTIICMHLSEEHLKEARASHINVVIAGHISSDNLGVNLVLDYITKKEGLKITACSGFTRFKR